MKNGWEMLGNMGKSLATYYDGRQLISEDTFIAYQGSIVTVNTVTNKAIQ